MWDDDNDKDVMRNQMLAIALMGVLMIVWFMYFMPPPAQPPAAPTGQSVSGDPQAEGTPQSEPGTVNAPSQTATTTPTPESAATGEWAIVPAVALANPLEDEVELNNAHLELVFTRVGARLKKAALITGENGDGYTQLIPQPEDGNDLATQYPLGLRFSNDDIGDAFDFARFDVAEQTANSITFRYQTSVGTLDKRFSLSGDRDSVVQVDVSYTHNGAGTITLGLDHTPAYQLRYAPNMVVEGEGRYFQPEFVWRADGVTEFLEIKKLPTNANGDPQFKRVPNAEWIGYKSIYFITAMRPLEGTADAGFMGRKGDLSYIMSVPEFTLQQGQTETASFEFYVGPMHMSDLREAWPTLDSSMRFFATKGFPGATIKNMMDWFARTLLRNLNWWHSFIPNYGVAIIMLTVLVRGAMFPLTLKQIRSAKQMRQLQPELKALKEEFKDNQQGFAQASMELYRERGINPLSGCFPLLLQMPVFFALYRMIWKSYELRGAGFLWIDDLSLPDGLFETPFLTGIPFVGTYLETFNLLPLLVMGSMILSMKMMPQSPAATPEQEAMQKTMMTLMPIIFGVVSWGFSAGLNLYVFTSTMLGILQNQWVRTSNVGGPPTPAGDATITVTPDTGGKSTPKSKAGGTKGKGKNKAKDTKQHAQDLRKKRKQHFYNKAQQRKREQARAARRDRKR